MPNFMKIRPVGAELSHSGGWTDRHDKLIAAFRNFANSPKKQKIQTLKTTKFESIFTFRRHNFYKYKFIVF
jgi:hypothetical protein